jgi:Peptidase family C25
VSKRSTWKWKWRMVVAIAATVACHALVPQALNAQTQCTSFSETTGPSTHGGALAPASGGAIQCASPRGACPSIVDTTTQYQYDVVGFKNTSGSTQCYTVTLTNNNGSTTGCSGGLFGAAYLDDFNPNSLCTNYAFADTGFSAITTTASYSFNVPTERNFFIVIEKFNAANVNACQYTFTLSAPSSAACTGTITAVTVESFTATSDDNARVHLHWRTGSEVDNLGFNIYREHAGERTRVNQHMIAGSALMVGAGTSLRSGRSYTWWDDSTRAAADTRYWLEAIDLGGQRTWHGPATIEHSTYSNRYSRDDQGQAALLSNVGKGATFQRLPGPVERRAARSVLSAVQSVPQAMLSTRPAVKLSVREEGWYRVTQAELVAAGLDPAVDPRFLHLYVDGREIPIDIMGQADGRFDPSDAIEFYGLGLDESWTDTRVYWLVVAERLGQRLVLVSTRGREPSGHSFPYTVERKDRTVYFSSLRNGDRENFFGTVVSQEPLEETLPVAHLDLAAPGTTLLEMALQGVTAGAHRVHVTLNGVGVGEVAFQDQDQGVNSFVVAPSWLREGDNHVGLTAQAGEEDISLVDSIRLTYWHTYTADHDALRFTATGGQRVTISGFSSTAIRLLDITEPDAVREVSGIVTPQDHGFALTLTVPGREPRTLLALTPQQAKPVAAITANQSSRWRRPGHGADLVIISHRDFLGSVEPLRTLRQNQGWRVVVVDVDDIFDEFNYGHKSPYAIRDFLRVATVRWEPAPRFVLLVGHASHDPKDYLGFGDSDFIPTKLVDTALMEAASDDWLADFDGDGLATLAVGRLPVRTVPDAERLVAKLLGYERAGNGSGVLLVTDSNDGFNFADATARVRELIPADVIIDEIDRGQLDADVAKSQLISSLNRGPALVNYVGHGSVDLWRGNLLTTEDARQLSNGERLSVFTPMTCLNGYFHDPALMSLAEALMSAEGGGAVAVWAPSGMTQAGGQAIMNQELYQVLFTESHSDGTPLTLGEAAMRAKASVSDQDIRRAWILIGDPTMRLKVR